jgi:asparagine synthase (glutamine-hydrolysing)
VSGISGIVRLNGRNVSVGEVRKLTDRMQYRGPDGISIWTKGRVGLGHCLMRTTEEAVDECQPLPNDEENIVLVFDGWLQNWQELRANLRTRGVRLKGTTDSELVLRAYEHWGHGCVAHLDGDFAFAIWDERAREMFCARDRIGMRPFHYHWSRESGLLFASDENALLGHPDVNRTLDEGRIADAIVGELEAFDLSSTFHKDIRRLPPAHTLIATPQRVTISRYWQYEPTSLLKLKSDADYSEALRGVLDEALLCRMRGSSTTQFMVSGGLDSSTSAALARHHSLPHGNPIRTVSAIGPDMQGCIETRCARAFAELPGVEPRFAALDSLETLLPDLINLSLSPLSPFDNHNALLRAVYLTARQSGARAVVDGVGGDLVLNDGGFLSYLLQKGRLITALRESSAAYQFWGRGAKANQRLYDAAKATYIPSWSRPWIRAIKRYAGKEQRGWTDSLIDPSFAVAVRLDERLAHGRRRVEHPAGSSARRAQALFHIHNVAARERYEREAARIGIEPRDPYLDLRVIEFCLSLPVELIVRNGWTKFILRHAMEDRLPDVIRWRKGRKHLGWEFSRTVMAASREALSETFEKQFSSVTPYVRRAAVERLFHDFRRGAELTKQQMADFYNIALLARFISARS